MSGKTEIRSAASWLQDHWDIRAAGNFIGGGTGAGILVMAAVAVLVGANVDTFIVLLGLAFVGLGLFCVWLEIGRMLRAAYVVFHPRTSWMTREAFVAVPLFGIGFFAAWFRDVGALVATGTLGLIFLYCQARILKAAKGIPAWRESTVVPFILLTGLAEGAALMVSISWLVVPTKFSLLLPPTLLALVVLRYVVWRAHQKRLIVKGMPVGTLQAFKKYDPLIFFGGHLIPIALFGSGLALTYPASRYAMILGALLAMLVGWLMKYVLITKAAFNQGFQLPKEPVRGKGKPGPSAKPGWTLPENAEKFVP